MSGRRIFPPLSLALKAAALLCMLLAVTAPKLWPARQLPPLNFLLDLSDSMPVAQVAERWQRLLREQRSLDGAGSRSMAFAANSRPLDAQTAEGLSAAQQRVDTRGTDIGAAIDAALAGTAPDSGTQFVLLSDGWSDTTSTEKALQNARRAGVGVFWVPLARADVAARLGAVDAPQAARAGQQATLAVQVLSHTARVVRLIAKTEGDAAVASPPLSLTPGSTSTLLAVPLKRGGAQAIGLQLLDASTSELLDARSPAAVVDVQGAGSALYVGHGSTPLLGSLQRGGWSVTGLAAEQLSRVAELDPFQAIVLDDVAMDDPGALFWRKLEQAVTQRGAGLIVLGGPRSFGAGGYRGSRLESLLPVTIEQAKDEQRAAVLFAIDKSGSMDSLTRGASRLAYARAAALATLRALPASDRAAVMTFDVAPQMLLPFADAPSVAAALEGSRELSASGGTRPAPALLEAARQLATERAAQKLLILVTDGFLPDEKLDPAIDALRKAGVELLTLAIGDDAQLGRLAALSASLRGEILRVGEAAELPRIMRAAVDARRAPVRSGPLAVHAANNPPFLETVPARWPAVLNYAVTRLRAPGNAVLESSRGEPILAIQQAGSGRVLALPAGLGAWAPEWSSWREWPRFVGAMANWAAGGIDDGRLNLSFADQPGEFIVRVDATDGVDWSGAAPPALTVIDPDGRRSTPLLAAQGPGRWQAIQNATSAGAYLVTVEQGSARQRRLHLRDAAGEQAVSGVNPQLALWEQRGLLRQLPADGLRSLVQAHDGRGVVRAGWLLCAWLAFLAAVLIDCRGVFASAVLTLRRRR